MRHALRQLLTFVLVLSLMPGFGELLENGEHLLHDGHLAHTSSHEGEEHTAGHEALAAEHGCTPVTHMCPCHVSIPALVPDKFELVPIVSAAVQAGAIESEQRPVTRANAPPVRPPIA
jgi:hypothetical protein